MANSVDIRHSTAAREGRAVIDAHAIARHYGGKVCKGNALLSTPGHSSRDRGTAIKPSPFAPDGVLVHCFNGTEADELAVRDMLRADGFLPADGRRRLTAKERRAIRHAEQARQRERQAREEAAARGAWNLWAKANHANPAHPYLVRKALEPFAIRQSGNALLVPMVDAAYRLRNIQRILPDGRKLFCKDAGTKGLFWSHGLYVPRQR